MPQVIASIVHQWMPRLVTWSKLGPVFGRRGRVENPLWRCVNNRYLRIAKIFVEWTEECRSNIFFRAQNQFLYFSETTPTPYPDKGESFCPRKCVIYSCVYESSTYKTFPKRHCVNIVSRHKCISQQWRQVSKINKSFAYHIILKDFFTFCI